MSTPAAENGSLRYWKAAIATLPPQKRDAAWEFYLNRIGDNRAGDTLSGLILLLEANGIFLQTLPAEFGTRLVQPLEHRLSDLSGELQKYAQEQVKVCASTGEALEQIDRACRSIVLCSGEVSSKVQRVVENISAEGIAMSICRSLESSALHRMTTTMRELKDGTDKLGQASQAARRSVELWRRIHVFGMFAWAVLTALMLTAIMAWYAETRIREYYQTRLAEEVTRMANKALRSR